MKDYTVEIHWEDAAHRSGWMSREEASAARTVTCSTVGYLLRRDKKEIVVAQNRDDENEFGDTMTIPAGWVKKVRRLK